MIETAISDEISLLLVEDSDMDAKRIDTLLRYSAHAAYKIHRATSLTKALGMLMSIPVDLVLLDPGLPDSEGLESVVAITKQFLDMPVVVLTGHDDFLRGVQCIQAGAQEYILKNELGTQSLERSVLHAIERKKAQKRVLKFYRDSIHAAVPDAATAVHFQQQNRMLTKLVDQIRSLVKASAPRLVPEIDVLTQQHVGSITPPPTPRSASVPLLTHVKEVVEKASDPSVPPSADPRGVIADVLDRYTTHGVMKKNGTLR
jgi:DNA-binding NarL/FixJ family response regulator